jgi:hypothetical protein
MKNTRFYAVWVLILTLMSFKTVTTLNQCSSKPKQPTPTVEIRRTKDGHLGAWVTNHPNLPQTLFLLQGFSNAEYKAPIRLENVHIEYASQCVVFHSRNTRERVVFKLKDATCANAQEQTTVFIGWGLIRASNDQITKAVAEAGSGSYPAVSGMDCKCFPEGGPMPFCDSGGKGATQCGTTFEVPAYASSCFVACAQGHYACCKE